MKVLSTKTVKNETIFEIELDAKKWKTSIANTKKDLAKNIQIQGFRKGHVPQAEIDRRISNEEVAMRSLNSQQNAIANELLTTDEFKKSDCIDTITKMEVVKLLPTPVIKVHMELVPKVENFSSKDVKEIAVPAYNAVAISDDVVKNQIKMMIRNDAMVSVKRDGIVKKGNIAVIDFKGFIDGKAFKGGEGKNFELEIGSKSFIDNFEDQLIDCKKGEKKDVNVKFPKDYGAKELAGKPAKFEVTINEVREIEYPEITKDYCKKFGMDCANMKELQAHIKNLFEQETQLRYQDMAMRLINDAISKQAKLTYFPASLVNMHKNQILRQYEQEANKAGFKTLDQYKKALKLDNAKFEQTLEAAAKTTLTIALTYEKLIEEYKLKVEAADKKDYLEKLTRYVGDEAKAKQLYEKNQEMADSNILRDKLFKKLVAEAKKEQPKKIK